MVGDRVELTNQVAKGETCKVKIEWDPILNLEELHIVKGQSRTQNC